jgi:hypothetical protein
MTFTYEQYGVLTAGLVIFVAALIIAIIGGISTWLSSSSKTNETSILEVPAVLASKRSHVPDSESSYTYYYVTFEFPYGQTKEFTVKRREYGLLTEGDQGTLRFQGARFLGFRREM